MRRRSQSAGNDGATWRPSSLSRSDRVKKARVEAIARQGGLCWWCDMPLDEDGPEPITAEHLRPRNTGGGNGRENIRAAHFGCNRNRGSHEDGPFEAYIHLRRACYLRSVGLYAQMPWRTTEGDGRREREIPNFGYDHDGVGRLWAPQFGLVFGLVGHDRAETYAAVRHGRRVHVVPIVDSSATTAAEASP